MPRGGAKPGERRGGRPAGTPNKATTEARELFRAFFEARMSDIQGLWVRVSEEDPAKALDLFVRMAEFHIPKLQRHEVTGESGKAIVFRIEEPAREPT